MARIRFLLIFAAVVALLLSGCSNKQVAVRASLGEVFTIGVGQSSQITGEDMTIRFVEVIGDSRCPQNVNCVWEGVASSKTTIVYQGKEYTVVLNSAGRTEEAKETFINYTLTYSLNPYPREGEEISPDEYRLTLTVTK
jgi:hypothetical protein